MRKKATPEVDELIELVRATTGALFHVTDKSNFCSIEKHGLLSKAEIDRLDVSVWNPGGSELTMQLDDKYGLWDYVFVGFQGGGLMPKHPNAKYRQPRVALIDPEVLRMPNVKIALGRANHRDTKVYGVKWGYIMMPQAAFTRYLAGDHDWTDQTYSRNYHRMLDYEILIPKRIAPDLILGHLVPET